MQRAASIRACRSYRKGNAKMTAEAISAFMDMIIRITIFGVCACFLIIGLALIWKWIIEIMISFVLYLFPGLKKPKDKKKDWKTG